MKKKSQTQEILEALINGYEITPLYALGNFGCFRLSARIKDLRAAGIDIKTEMVEHRGKRFAKYFMPLAEIKRLKESKTTDE